MMMRSCLPVGFFTLTFLGACSGVHGEGKPRSNSLLEVSPDGKLLLAANTENGSITVVDLDSRQSVGEIQVGGRPEGVALVGDGPLALVTLYGDDEVAFVDTHDRRILQKLKMANEPYGVVISQDGSKAYISHDYPGMVSEIDIATRKVIRTIPAGKWARGIALSADGKMLYVTDFYSATLRAIDLEQGKVVDVWEGHATQNLCRNVVLHPTRPKAYLSNQVSRVTVFDSESSIIPELSICDLRPTGTLKDKPRRRSIAMDTYNGVHPVSDPWEAAVTPDGRKIFSIYAGNDEMNVSEVVNDDYSEIDPIGRPISLGRNPRAVRVNPNGKEFYVYNTLDFSVAVYNVATVRKIADIHVCAPPNTPEWVRGKILFESANRPMARRAWVACASCHSDGLPDNRVWHNPEGPRKTPPLQGVAHTHPLHYSADRDEVQDFEYTIRGKLMGGSGLAPSIHLKPKVGYEKVELEEKLAGRSKDLDALAIYTNSFRHRLSPHIQAPGKLSPEAERGKALFSSKEVGCANCHSGPYYTDSSLQKPYKLHDIGTGDDPEEKMGPKYDTPSLLGIYRTAPYLHHGKAATLMDVLTTYNKGDRHGKTSQLSKDQREDLVAFLKSLPYEIPPDETPNSVPYRLMLPGKKEKSEKPAQHIESAARNEIVEPIPYEAATTDGSHEPARNHIEGQESPYSNGTSSGSG